MTTTKTDAIMGAVALLVACVAVFAYFHGEDSAGNTQSPLPTVAVAIQKSKVNKFSPKQKESARVVMDAAKGGHHIYEEGGHLVVEMGRYVEDKNILLAFVSRIADADCVLQGGPRNIYYYNPSMKKIAQADPVNGVRLID
jgi:hypothetical protein